MIHLVGLADRVAVQVVPGPAPDRRGRERLVFELLQYGVGEQPPPTPSGVSRSEEIMEVHQVG